MKYMSLDQRGHVQAEYIWIDAIGGTRSKTKVRDYCTSCSCNLPPIRMHPASREEGLLVRFEPPRTNTFLSRIDSFQARQVR